MQFNCDFFRDSEEEFQKFDALVGNSIATSQPIREEGKQFIADNINRWMFEKPSWFSIDMIQDVYLPADVLAAEGGEGRRRMSVSLFGVKKSTASKMSRSNGRVSSSESVSIHSFQSGLSISGYRSRDDDPEVTERREGWLELADQIFSFKSNNYK